MYPAMFLSVVLLVVDPLVNSLVGGCPSQDGWCCGRWWLGVNNGDGVNSERSDGRLLCMLLASVVVVVASCCYLILLFVLRLLACTRN